MHVLVQLHVKDVKAEFELMFTELRAWHDAYRTCMVPKQVRVQHTQAC